jgi:cytochrome oxidase assembly protein ShyY1
MWALHIAGVVAIVATTLLGMWQYGVWGHHRAVVERDLQNAAPVSLQQLLGGTTVLTTDQVGAPVTVTGTWLTDSTFYVSGRQLDGSDGYWQVTPLGWADPADHATLVVVGFVAQPSGPAPTGSAAVTGWLQPSDGGSIIDADPSDDILPTLSTASAAQRLTVTLSPGYVVMKSAAPAVASTVVPPDSLPRLGATTSIRNLFYAFQWWTFGAFALFMWWRWSMDAVLADRQRQGEMDESAAEERLESLE